ncbi:hypothetical protein D0T49_00330 [Paludibacter sp. 221]|uniref:HK97 family phage prohead protease n=1 Tax=Paludibacter sp. 221 TaxID=2302939 RepID=UPI0013D21B25|nr:HK97 family phage prohead protease [Paludibacter sp. 221]NDV45499.1 hypothetical protein [Paludibacter sp. 221]
MDEKEKKETPETEKDFTLSDSSRINTKGFRVDLAGGRYERFDANPVMLYDHDTKHLIGRWENRRVENGVMMAKPVFNLKNAFAAEKAQEVKDEFLRGASIGLIPYQMEKIGDDYVLTDWELLEASITPIPSDAGAVRLYNEKREIITFEQLKLSFLNNNQTTKTMDEKETIVLTAVTRQSLGLSATPTAKQIELAVQEKDDKIEELNSKIKTLQAAQVDAYLSQAVKDGKITEAEKSEYVKLSQGDNFDNVKAIIDAKKTESTVSLKDMAAKTNLTAGDRASWTYLKWSQDDPDGLRKLQHENPTEFDRILQEYTKNNK